MKTKKEYLYLSLEICYPETFSADHKRGVSLNGSHNGIECHSRIIFKGSLDECQQFIADYEVDEDYERYLRANQAGLESAKNEGERPDDIDRWQHEEETRT